MHILHFGFLLRIKKVPHLNLLLLDDLHHFLVLGLLIRTVSLQSCELLLDRGQLFFALFNRVEFTLQIIQLGDHLDVTGVQIAIHLGKFTVTTKVYILGQTLLLGLLKLRLLLLHAEL